MIQKLVQYLHGLSVVTSSLKASSVSPPPCTRQSPKSYHSKTQASQERRCSCSCSSSSFTLLQQARPRSLCAAAAAGPRHSRAERRRPAQGEGAPRLCCAPPGARPADRLPPDLPPGMVMVPWIMASIYLKTKLKGLEATVTNLENTQKELEVALTEKDSHINQIEEKAAGTNPDQMAALMELLQRKEVELEEIKIRFQDYKITDRKGPNGISGKSTPVQTNNANATSDIVVVEKATNSSGAMPTKAEGKSSSNTTVTASKHQKDRSLEEKRMKSTTNMEDDGLQDKTSDVVEDIDQIYGESHSRKSEFPHRNKKFLTNSRVGSGGEELDGIELSWHSLDQDSDRVRYNKLLEKENDKASDETKKPNKTDGDLEKISIDILSNANQNKSKQAVEEMAGAADVKPKMSVNNDGTQQQNKRHKKRSRSKKKKMTDIATIIDDGEVTKEREVDATSIPE